jgi:hypothetical protein
MSRLPWTQILNWVLTAFFVVGFVINTFAVKVVGPEYRRWGYPDWFHFASGGLDLMVALLLLRNLTRPFGVALGCVIMLVAIATVVRHREYRRAAAPLIVFVLLAILGCVTIAGWLTIVGQPVYGTAGWIEPIRPAPLTTIVASQSALTHDGLCDAALINESPDTPIRRRLA